MSVWLVTRHPGAVEWAAQRGIQFDQHVAHLDPVKVGAGDTVIGSLPVHLAAAVCARGARYLNLSLDLPAAQRGRELGAGQLVEFNARLEEFVVTRVTNNETEPAC